MTRSVKGPNGIVFRFPTALAESLVRSGEHEFVDEAPEPEIAPAPEPASEPTPKKRGRPKKTAE